MERFESMWRSKEVKPWGQVYEYKSPDGRWKINYRTVSSNKSKDKIEKAGYKVEVTLDVIPAKWKKREIKFILLR